MFSRLNIAYIACDDYEYHEHKQDMLLSAIKRKFPDVEYLIMDSKNSRYIDHQSLEDIRDTIFESDSSVYDFLFKSDSYIELDNDNH